MTLEVKVPVLPESVADGTIATWHKKVGDAVKRDENLLDLETDKVVLEVPAPANGVLRELKVESGATVTSGQLIAVLEERVAGAKGAAAQPAASPQPCQMSGHRTNWASANYAERTEIKERIWREERCDPRRDGRGGSV